MPRLNASQSTRVFTWARRPPIRIDLAPPLFNTLYPILQSSGGFRLRYLRYQQQNDEVAAKDLTLEGFIDGEVVNSLVGADSGGVNDYFLLTVLDNQWNFG
ncbi:hypothetical protein MUO79_05845, partial [Candidatus Bathyarchaeota archaeon]|nr:hypothetical protein [Candidatus Bathyarchaeota archaeon]